MTAPGTNAKILTIDLVADAMRQATMTILEQIGGKRPSVLANSHGRVRYLIGVGDIGTRFYLVRGDCLQNAIDFIVDIDGDNVPGFFADEDTTQAYWNDDDPCADEHYAPAGNAGKLFTNELHVICEGTRRWRLEA